MSKFRLPTQKGTVLFPQVTAQPVPVRIRGVPPGSLQEAEIMARYGGMIQRFFLQQHQRYSLSVLPFQSAIAQQDGVRMRYLNNAGQASVVVEVPIPTSREVDKIPFLVGDFVSVEVLASTTLLRDAYPTVYYEIPEFAPGTLFSGNWSSDDQVAPTTKPAGYLDAVVAVETVQYVSPFYPPGAVLTPPVVDDYDGWWVYLLIINVQRLRALTGLTTFTIRTWMSGPDYASQGAGYPEMYHRACRWASRDLATTLTDITVGAIEQSVDLPTEGVSPTPRFGFYPPTMPMPPFGRRAEWALFDRFYSSRVFMEGDSGSYPVLTMPPGADGVPPTVSPIELLDRQGDQYRALMDPNLTTPYQLYEFWPVEVDEEGIVRILRPAARQQRVPYRYTFAGDLSGGDYATDVLFEGNNVGENPIPLDQPLWY